METIRSQTRAVERDEVDAGLRAYMLGVYNLMIMAMLITGVVAYGTFSLATVATPNGLALTAFGEALYTPPLSYVFMFAPLAIAFFLIFRVNSMSVATARMTFVIYSAMMGAWLSTIFLIYQGESIAQVFFITAAAFGALSLYGYSTSRNLSGLGSFLIMGLFGIIIASIVNLFLQSEMTSFVISILGVLIFSGLTAYDTQKIKENYFVYSSMGNEAVGRSSVMGALTLYLDFINLFLYLLRLLGNRN